MCVANAEPIKRPQTVMVGDQECLVETLREWLNQRIAGIRQSKRLEREYADDARLANLDGRLAELTIIREKINDGRIQEIG